MTIRIAAMAIAAVVALSPLPAVAQTGVLPQWMVGKWCAPIDRMDYCMSVSPMADGKAIVGYTRQEGPEAEIEQLSIATITVEDGRLTMRSTGAGTLYREDPHGPRELIMANVIPENVTNGDAMTIRYTRERDRLTVEFGFGGGEQTVAQSYGLSHPPPPEKPEKK